MGHRSRLADDVEGAAPAGEVEEGVEAGGGAGGGAGEGGGVGVAGGILLR
jgi:hypothetical protein